MEENINIEENIEMQEKSPNVVFVENFANQLDKEQKRLTSEPSETAAARKIRDIIASANSDFKARLEPFYARPLLGRRCYFFMAIWLLICDVIYFLSFQKNPTAALVLTLFAFVLFGVGMGILLAMFFGVDKFNFLLPKKACYNVETEFTTPYKYSLKSIENVEPNQTIVICANHDSLPGTYFENNDIFKKISLFYTPIFMVIFMLFCLIKMGTGIDTTGKIAALSIIPGLLSVFALFIFATQYSLFAAHTRENNCIGSSVALAVFASLYGMRNHLPENTRFVYASFGGENSGHAGSKAFVDRHIARDKNFTKAKVVCIDEIRSGTLLLAKSDMLRKAKYSEEMVKAVQQASKDLNIVIGEEKDLINNHHGHIATAFVNQRIEAVSILGAEPTTKSDEMVTTNTIQNLFDLTMQTIQNILIKDNI